MKKMTGKITIISSNMKKWLEKVKNLLIVFESEKNKIRL